MPYPRASEGYPVAFREVIEQVAGLNAPHKIACSSEKEARALRARFHAFRVACRRDAASPPSHWEGEQVRQHRTFLALFEGLVFSVEGSELIIAPRDAECDLLARLVPLEGTPQSAEFAAANSSALESLQRVLGKLGEKDG